MKSLKTLGLAAIAAAASMALAAGSASATTLETNGVANAGPTTLTASADTSITLARTDGFLANTCRKTSFEGTTSTNTGAAGTGTHQNQFGIRPPPLRDRSNNPHRHPDRRQIRQRDIGHSRRDQLRLPGPIRDLDSLLLDYIRCERGHVLTGGAVGKPPPLLSAHRRS